MHCQHYFRTFVFILFVTLLQATTAQTLTVNEIITSPHVTAYNTDDLLKRKVWEQYSFEINKYSEFVKRVWMIKNQYTDLKSSYSYFQSDVDSYENQITYQFSHRATFLSYQSDLKSKGYKLSPEKKKKDKFKDKGYTYINEITSSLFSSKEVFMLGLIAFLTDSHQLKSQMAKRILEEKIVA